MTLLEQIVAYATVGATVPDGLRLEHIEVGEFVWETLLSELEEVTGVSVRGVCFSYRKVIFRYNGLLGDGRIDATWSHPYLNQLFEDGKPGEVA